MREIKFRGIEFKTGKWRYGNLTIMHNIPLIMQGKRYKTRGTHYFICRVSGESENIYWVDPETIGQYTGLKDKNGKEIYEGDIVKGELIDLSTGKTIKNKISVIKDIRNIPDYVNCEVIGNIYDNPELLPSKKENQDGTHKDNKA